LRGDVDGLRGDVGGLRGDVDGLHGDVGGLRADVQKLRVLAEENERQIKLLTEVQGAKFEQIAEALKPLAQIHDFIRLVADNHEHRIAELEKRAGVPE
jgi:hypothetical protein